MNAIVYSPEVLAYPDAGVSAVPGDQLNVLPGFKVDLLYSVPRSEQGSWVAMTFDDRGRIIASAQGDGLYRITLPPVDDKDGKAKVERLKLDLGGAHGLLYAFDSLYVMVAERREENQTGFYRLRDTTGDDQFDEVKLIKRLEGAGEHGPHAIVLSPDGESLFVLCGNATMLPEIDASRVPRNWGEDHLLPRMLDPSGAFNSLRAPGGFVCKVSPEGDHWELFAIGFRNPYDIAFCQQGELFTFDSDNERDIGLPWYRPTRICHVVSGGEYGWRTGSSKWPNFYPDSMPSYKDLGRTSPTGVVFGTNAAFPEKYQRALFACDWMYGQIFAVHVYPYHRDPKKRGAYEKFITGKPLPVTDIAVGPDRAMYFITGGRNTQSGLYRVTYVGEEATAAVGPLRKGLIPYEAKRDRLNGMHGRVDDDAIGHWGFIACGGDELQYAARTAIEHQPVDAWTERAFDEKDVDRTAIAMMMLARCGDKELQPRILSRLNELKVDLDDKWELIRVCRAYALTFIRMGRPDDETVFTVRKRIEALYRKVNGSRTDQNSEGEITREHVNRELIRLLIYLESPVALREGIILMQAGKSQEEKAFYLFHLRHVDKGWTLSQRRTYFRELNNGFANYEGDRRLRMYMDRIRAEVLEKLSDQEKKALGSLVEAKFQLERQGGRKWAFTQDWKMDDLLPVIDQVDRGRSFRNGQSAFHATRCAQCHTFAGSGGGKGPDLTGVGNRFNPREILQSIVEPSHTIAEQFQDVRVTLKSGETIIGALLVDTAEEKVIATNPFDTTIKETVAADEVASIKPHEVSAMPTGLINILESDDVLDLIAYLRSNGDKTDGAFVKD